jgi:hypothetical protein
MSAENPDFPSGEEQTPAERRGILTNSGQEVQIVREEGENVIFLDKKGRERRVPINEIEEIGEVAVEGTGASSAESAGQAEVELAGELGDVALSLEQGGAGQASGGEEETDEDIVGKEFVWTAANDPANVTGWKVTEVRNSASGNKFFIVTKEGGKPRFVPEESFNRYWVAAENYSPPVASEEEEAGSGKEQNKPDIKTSSDEELAEKIQAGTKLRHRDGFEIEITRIFTDKRRGIRMVNYLLPNGGRATKRLNDLVDEIGEGKKYQLSENAEDEIKPGSHSEPLQDGDQSDAKSGQEGKKEKRPVPEVPESSWLDPRRIQELQAEYKDVLGQNQNLSEAARTHLKAIIIEKEITRAIKAAQQVQHLHGIGEVPEYPSDSIKQKMLEMMDQPDDEITAQASALDENLHSGFIFKKDQPVVVDGEEGWKVLKMHYNHVGDTEVIVEKDDQKRYFSPEALKNQQEQSGADKDKEILEKLKPFLENPKAKVELGDGRIVLGEFRGYSTTSNTDEKVYVADENGNLLPEKISVEQFMGWQNKKITEEVENEKTAELEAKLDRYKNNNVKANAAADGSGDWLEGYKFIRYDKDIKRVMIAREGEDEVPINLETFIKWQEDGPEQEEAEGDDDTPVSTPEHPYPDIPGDATEIDTDLMTDLERIEASREVELTFRQKLGKIRSRRSDKKAAKRKEGDEALAIYEKKVADWLETLPLWKRIPIMGVGYTALATAVATPALWIPDYLAYRTVRTKAVKNVKKGEQEQEARERERSEAEGEDDGIHET